MYSILISISFTESHLTSPTMVDQPPTEQPVDVSDIPIRPISGGKSENMPSWSDFLKQIEEEEKNNPTQTSQVTMKLHF